MFSIELVPAFGSVFSAFLPTVGCPLVVSTFGASFFSFDSNFVVTVVTNSACAFSTSAVVVVLAACFAFAIALRNIVRLASVFESYLPEDRLPSISVTYLANFSFEAANSF